MKPLLVFDMDGVLVDVSESYRETIRETVKFFTGRDVTHEQIQDYKNAGGWNNDWALSQKIAADYGVAIDYDTVVREFQRIFFGANGVPGLMERERWIAGEGLLERLNERYAFAVFTGRLREEAAITLRRFGAALPLESMVAEGEVENGKPAPDGLLLLQRQFPGSELTYVGDTVDDARSARGAGVRFIGIAHRANPRHALLSELLRAEGAVAVLDNINELEAVL